eukprot:NODE_725_length_4426_cov_0.934597.p1 type:complete len:318 gc:universal NODE_725_length_4426_cov_0.934597:1205-2158(+)
MIVTVAAVGIAIYTFIKLRGFLMINRFIVDGRECLVTGGSQGLGKSIAKELVKKGANVVICARRKEELEKAVAELDKLKIHKNQVIKLKVCDVTDPKQVENLFLSENIQFLFCCVGASKPMLFEDQSISQLDNSLKLNYSTAVYSAFYAAKKMKIMKESSKIVFVGSTLSCFGMIGFSEYVPAKFALRGLAETLRNEFLKDNIDVHIYLPGSIDTPGFVEEQKTKPEVSKFIEGQTKPENPDTLAKKLIRGLELNYFAITTDFVTEMVYVAGRGVAPVRNVVNDLFSLLLAIPFSIAMRFFIDFSVLSHYKKSKKQE